MLQAPLTRFFFSHSFSKSLLSPVLRWVRSTGKQSSGPALPCCLWGHPCPSRHLYTPRLLLLSQASPKPTPRPTSLLRPHPHSPFTSSGQATPSPAPWPQQGLTHRTIPLLTLQRRGREGAREEISPSRGQKPLIPSQPYPFHKVGRGSD